VKSNTHTAEVPVDVLYIKAPLAVKVTPVKDISLKFAHATPLETKGVMLTKVPPPVTY